MSEAMYYSDIISNYGRSSSLGCELESSHPKISGLMKKLGLYKPPLKLEDEITVNLPWIPSARELTNDGDSIVDRMFDYLDEIVQRVELSPDKKSTVKLRLEAGVANELWTSFGCRDDDWRLDSAPDLMSYFLQSFNRKFAKYGVECAKFGMSGDNNREIRFGMKLASD